MYILCFNQIFLENAVILSNQINIPLLQDFQPEDNQYYIIYGAQDQIQNLYNIQLNYKVKYIILNSESEKSNTFRNKYYLKLLKNNYVLNYSKSNTQYLKTININTIGYFTFDFKPAIQLEREYKIGFIGSKNDKRLSILSQLSEKHKMYIHFDNQLNNMNSIKSTLLNCEWIVNIPYYNHKNFESHRVNNALSCGCKVVSLSDSMDEKTIKKYEPYIYITNDLIKFFDNIPTDTKQIYKLDQNEYIFNKWLFNKIISTL